MPYFLKYLKWTTVLIFSILYILFFGINITYDVLFENVMEKQQLGIDNPHELPELSGRPIGRRIPQTLLPFPVEIDSLGGMYAWKNAIRLDIDEPGKSLVTHELKQLFGDQLTTGITGPIWRFFDDPDLPSQGYELKIEPGSITVKSGDAAGRYYALVTLNQIYLQNPTGIPCLEIRDKPSLEIRGIMLDISRDKVPKMETLYMLMDLFSQLKINHVQLYVEGFSFDYPSFQGLWPDTETPITGEEIRLLDQYCKNRYIDLVPNQNSLGHMQAWLATERFRDLAECPEGYNLGGLINMITTLDPYDERSIQLIELMTDDLLPNFTSSYFNANLDEPFELGQCKSKKEAEEKGVGIVYLDFVKKVKAILDQHDKKMMMWGDIISKHPEIINEVPKDIIVIEWGYESFHPFDEKCAALQESGLEFMVAPGTSCWMSFAGRTENMMGNIENAVINAVEYGAKGMLNTDWGDLGHWQYLPASYPGYAYGAALSWNHASKNNINLGLSLNQLVFRDASRQLGPLVLDLGNYNQFEEFLMPHLTLTYLGYQFGLVNEVLYDQILDKALGAFAMLAGEGNDQLWKTVEERINDQQSYRYKELMTYLSSINSRLNETHSGTPDSTLIIDQLRNGIRMIQVGASIKHYIHTNHAMSWEEKISYLKEVRQISQLMVSEHQRLWLQRNRSGGLDRSLATLEKIDAEINDNIEVLEAGGLKRFMHRQKGKVIAVGAYVLFKFI